MVSLPRSDPSVPIPDPADWGRVLVYGLGLSGRAAIRLLRRSGVRVLAYDERPRASLERPALHALEGDPAIEWRFGAELDELPPDLDALVLSPGVPPDRTLARQAQERGLEVVAEVELAYRALAATNCRVAAITGTNGKSTTTALTGHLLRSAGLEVEVCGNIGEPMSDRVAGAEGRVFVVELSSFQLESVHHFHPQVGALLNVTPDHLDRYGTLEAYRRAKERIFSRQGRGDVAVLGWELRDATARLASGVRPRLFSLGPPVGDGCFLRGDAVLEVSGAGTQEILFRTDDLPLAGLHNLENAMAAALVARALGVPSAALARGLRSFEGLPHRVQRVAVIAGVAYYDDSKGTNMAATLRSLEGFADGSVHLILGGRNKDADPATLRAMVTRKASALYLIGEAASAFQSALAGTAELYRAGTLERAVRRAAERASAGEVVLLSPACASFDQFRDYVQRGETFKALVRDLEQEGQAGG